MLTVSDSIGIAVLFKNKSSTLASRCRRAEAEQPQPSLAHSFCRQHPYISREHIHRFLDETTVGNKICFNRVGGPRSRSGARFPGGATRECSRELLTYVRRGQECHSLRLNLGSGLFLGCHRSTDLGMQPASVVDARIGTRTVDGVIEMHHGLLGST